MTDEGVLPLDITVADVDEAEAAVLELGATSLSERRQLARLRRPGRQAFLPLLG